MTLKDMEKVVKGPIQNSAWSQEEESDEKGVKLGWKWHSRQNSGNISSGISSMTSPFLSLSTATADSIGQGAASDLLFEARDGLPRPTRQIQIH